MSATCAAASCHMARFSAGEAPKPPSSVAEADALGARGARGQEDLGRRGVRVLLQEVVLDLPGVVDPEPVGQLHLRERLVDEAHLAVLLPGSGELVLVEDAELHGRGSSSGRRYSARATPVKRRRRTSGRRTCARSVGGTPCRRPPPTFRAPCSRPAADSPAAPPPSRGRSPRRRS